MSVQTCLTTRSERKSPEDEGRAEVFLKNEEGVERS